MALAVGCASGPKVQYDYDVGTDFERLKTYDWLPIPVKAEVNQFNVIRVKRAVDTQLAKKGFVLNPESPDFLIATHGGKTENVRVIDWSSDYGLHWKEEWVGGDVTSFGYGEITLILTFIEAQSKEKIWQGTARATLGQDAPLQKQEQAVDAAVEEMFADFPPGASK